MAPSPLPPRFGHRAGHRCTARLRLITRKAKAGNRVHKPVSALTPSQSCVTSVTAFGRADTSLFFERERDRKSY